MTTLYRLFFESKTEPEYESVMTGRLLGPTTLRKIEGMLRTRSSMGDGTKTVEQCMEQLGYKVIIRSVSK